ncbi:hypothetical protein [Labilibaculum filiforme]|nr:hypothetical protein [Labilibaculum filiforme]
MKMYKSLSAITATKLAVKNSTQTKKFTSLPHSLFKIPLTTYKYG